jgi:large conductance mechanosensitive channel
MSNLKEKIEEKKNKIKANIPPEVKEKIKAHSHYSHKFAHEFMDFLKEYKIIGLAIAFIVGAAANQLVKSLVDNIVMPFIGPLIPSGTWQEAVWTLGPFALSWGKFISDLIYFIIVALVIFVIAKKLLKKDKTEKR